ncbi:hypothetical protein AMTRI_Chr01g108650 [Amborella trichopoda]|uniref:Protein MIZU-KUSSEI 1 n=1 Tax=Amborella trichopoda TaxID=13333 RepID=W1PB83_AMBTC|nr:protein MIZU-KUSSEI 1 [Amborella trichopoda]ERN05183.1 hypothetical protein AMTR_s00053p00226450 [Amborella trichopoda]|eukprot:XP_006843508.1 protein MIZU-KUSSEI 1 [Amborella trichopoda]
MSPESPRLRHSSSLGAGSRKTPTAPAPVRTTSDPTLVRGHAALLPNRGHGGGRSRAMTLTSSLRCLVSRLFLPLPTISMACRFARVPAPCDLGRRVTGTLFGHRKGHVTFSVQASPSAEPALLLELAVPTSGLVKEMGSGLVRIALECGRVHSSPRSLFDEPVWSMYCNGRKAGYAVARACSEGDWRVLSAVKAVSVGAGVLPPPPSPSNEGEEVMYMRARFERVVGSRDSEAFYMVSPDGNGGPELSIFLLRI